ncbi:MAG: DUF4388 domain-containing protein [Nitrospiraceae bacterium]|nr:DUF4388 domain-containing protein [Nitrospiraceae bacterium]
MALEGTLKEFGIADILQLIYYQRKSGVLTVETGFDRVTIFFYEGNIVFVESGKRTESRMGRLLLKKGLIKKSELEDALAQQKTTGAKLGNTLVKMGAISGESLKETLVQQFTELVSYLFTWRQGRYEFKPQGVPLDKAVPISLDTQHILMEGLRILDEWSQMGGRITLESVFAKTGGLPGDTGGPASPASVTEMEKRIYDLVDGENDVSTIAVISGMDSFRISKTLLDLYEKGLIEKKGAQDEFIQKSEDENEGLPARKRRLPAFLVEGLLAVFFLVSVAVFYTGYTSGPGFSKPYLASREIDRLRFRVRVYKVENGRYPVNLERVGNTTDPWGNPYVYKVDGSGFTLFSTGPDGTAGTKDDVY